MKLFLSMRNLVRGLILSIGFLHGTGLAYPPAPSHLIYGLVRDEMGNPLSGDATIILETSSGFVVKTVVASGLAPAINYRLYVPMDSGLVDDLYKPTALRPFAPFKLKVQIGQKTFYPIEMRADYSNLGLPAQKTRIDLTLGEDADGDGLPDAWERAWLALYGKTQEIKDLSPNDHLNGNCLSISDQYVAGTYAVDNKEGFVLKIHPADNRPPFLEFMAIRGRSYTIYGSADMKSWSPVQFKLKSGNSTVELQSYHYATETQLLQVEPEIIADGSQSGFFKLLVQ